MANDEENENKKPSMQGLSFAYRISTELLGALIVSVVIGLLIDKVFDSKPIGLITLIILGFFAGLLNIYRLIRRIENSKEICFITSWLRVRVLSNSLKYNPLLTLIF